MRLALYGLTVLALLGGAYGYLTFGSKAFDPVATAKLDVKAIEKAAVAYCIKSGEFPPNLDALVSAGSLDSSATRDPWKNAYQYDPAGKKNKGARPDIWTVSPSREVIGNWTKNAK